MSWLTFIPLPFLIADLLGCREQRAVRREGREGLQQLSREDQRSIGRALRRGEAVQDPRLAAATIGWTASLEAKCFWNTLFCTVYLGTFVAAAAFAMLAGEWTAAAKFLLVFDFFALMFGVGDAAKRRAKPTELATRALLLDQRPRRPD